MMRRWSGVLVCAMLFFTWSVWCQTASNPNSSEKAKEELVDLKNRWLHAEEDPDVQETILAPDFLHVLPGGIIAKAEQLSYMRKHPAQRPSPTKHFEDMHVRIYGSVGIVNGVVVRGEAGATYRTLFTDVFAYRQGKWQAVTAQELHGDGPH